MATTLAWAELRSKNGKPLDLRETTIAVGIPNMGRIRGGWGMGRVHGGWGDGEDTWRMRGWGGCVEDGGGDGEDMWRMGGWREILPGRTSGSITILPLLQFFSESKMSCLVRITVACL